MGVREFKTRDSDVSDVRVNIFLLLTGSLGCDLTPNCFALKLPIPIWEDQIKNYNSHSFTDF